MVLREIQTRNYSQRSIDTYIHLLHELEEYYKCSIDEVTADQVKDFLQYSITERNLSVSYINQVISAVKILQQDVLGKSYVINLITFFKGIDTIKPNYLTCCTNAIVIDEIPGRKEMTAKPEHTTFYLFL